MQILEYVLIIAGAFTVLASLLMYRGRTQTSIGPVKLLRGQIELNATEFLANRIGLYLLVMGVVVRYVNQIS